MSGARPMRSSYQGCAMASSPTGRPAKKCSIFTPASVRCAAMDVTPIGHVAGGRSEPRDDEWGAEVAVIRLDAQQYGPEALEGLRDFSHAEVIYHFHLVPD